MISSIQIGKRRGLAVLPALFLILLTGLLSSISYAAWENVGSVVIEQGHRTYERSSRTYYTFNTLTNQSGSELQGPLRFLVTSASHPVINADGSDVSGEYFDVLPGSGSLAAGQSLVPVRINFQRIRAAFAYTVVLQQEVLDIDADEDGIPDSEDLCPNDATNLCMSISGQVNGGGAALENAVIKIGLNFINATSVSNGSFIANVGPEGFASDNISTFFPVEVTAPGFATGYGKVIYVSGTDHYDFLINLEPVSTTIDPENDDVTTGVDINKEGVKVGTLTIPLAALPSGVTSVSGDVTYLDPATDDLDSTPGGDLLALPIGSNPNDTPVLLESFGMMEFNLTDQNGVSIHELSAPAEVCMQAGAGLSAGDTIPLWWFNTANGLWEEESDGTVVDRDGQLLICGAVTHFTWWNYDRPVTQHACFKYHMVSDQTNPLNSSLSSSFNWHSEGVTYNGRSPQRATDRDANDPLTPLANDKINSLTVKRSMGGNIEQNRVYTNIAGTKLYLKRDGEQQYSLTAVQSMATVFDDPTASGSGLLNVDVQNCQFLDYMDTPSDGVLEIVTAYNLPPVISQFSAVSNSVLPGNSTTVNATITDPEGEAVTSSWSTRCFSSFGVSSGDESILPTSEINVSGSVFSPLFTAPTTLAGPYENCQVILQATDAQGATTMAEYWVTVVVENFIFSVQGTLHGVDGLPLVGAEVKLFDNNCSNSYTEITDLNGQYSINIDLCPGSQPQDFSGRFETRYSHPDDRGGSAWTQTNYVEENSFDFGRNTASVQVDIPGFPPFAGSCVYDGTVGSSSLTCQEDIYLPVLWGELSGATGGGGSFMSIWHQSGRFDFETPDTNTSLFVSPSPLYSLLVPVGGISQISAFGGELSVSYSMPNTNGMRIDLGAYDINLHIKVFNDAGDPLFGTNVWAFRRDGGFFGGDVLSSADVTIFDGELLGSTNMQGELNVIWSTGFSATPFRLFADELLNHTDFVATAHYAGEDVVVAINSQEMCSVVFRVYDNLGMPKGNQFISLSIESGSVNGFTNSSGDFMFMARVGGYIELPGFFTGDMYDAISGVQIGSCPIDELGNPQDILFEWVQEFEFSPS